jgi:hypothetical protein
LGSGGGACALKPAGSTTAAINIINKDRFCILLPFDDDKVRLIIYMILKHLSSDDHGRYA